jgi:hypothetical protein
VSELLSLLDASAAAVEGVESEQNQLPIFSQATSGLQEAQRSLPTPVERVILLHHLLPLR